MGRTLAGLLLWGASIALGADEAHAFQITVQAEDFSSQTNVYSDVTGFNLSIEVLAPLAPGAYVDPPLGDIEFLVAGSLDPTTPARTANPSFVSFAVGDLDGLSGQAFYDLGNALRFEISASANLSDGLQVTELVGAGPVFVFDGRELGTGRYHPPILQLSSDGTGSIQNSNNMGGINPVTQVEVNASVGDEYIAELGFAPEALTLVVPEPGTGALLALGIALLARPSRFRQ